MIVRTSGWASLLLAACSPSDSSNEGGKAEFNRAKSLPAKTPLNYVAAKPVPAALATQNVSRFTQGLQKCRLIEKNEEEGSYYRHRCTGVGGFAYEVVESDLRQDLVIIGPNGRRDELSLSSVAGGGGFNILGATFEWRGPAGAAPRTLTVRFNVNEDPDPKVPARSYLIVIRLAAPACPIAAIAPGPTQSAEARRIADSPKLPACLAQ